MYIRLSKEIRPLLSPFAVMLAGMLLPLALWLTPIPWSPVFLWQFPLVIWMIGTALLGVCAFAFEHQILTMPLLLSQPVSRLRIWGEKYRVLLPMTLVPIVFLVAAWPSDARFVGPGDTTLFAVSFFVSLASAPFWAGLTRSTIGAFAFNVTGQIVAFVVCLSLGDNASDLDDILPLGGLVYGGGLLLLGWLQFGRAGGTQQAVPREQVESRSSLQAGYWALTPRCQSRGKWRNVVRRELCLQRSTFQVGLSALVLLLVLLAFDLSSNSRGTLGPLDILLFAPFILATVGAALLAGPTALCEENTLGTATWSQTLPASVRGQFFVKALVAAGVFFLVGLAGPAMALLAYHQLVPRSFGGELAWELFGVVAIVLSVIFLLSLRIAALAPSTLNAVLTTFTAALAGLVPLYASLGNLGPLLRPLEDYELERGTLLWRVATTMTPFGFPLPILLAIATVVLVVASLLWKASGDFGRVRSRGTAIMTGISCALLPILVLVAVGLCQLSVGAASVTQQTSYLQFQGDFATVVANLEADNPRRNTRDSRTYTMEQIRAAGATDPDLGHRFVNPRQNITVRTVRAGNEQMFISGRRMSISRQQRTVRVVFEPALLLEENPSPPLRFIESLWYDLPP